MTDPYPKIELTEQQKLQADIIRVTDRIPVGLQIAVPMHLDTALAEVRKLYSEHELPMQDELLSELMAWRQHAQQTMSFAHQVDHLTQALIRTVSKT